MAKQKKAVADRTGVRRSANQAGGDASAGQNSQPRQPGAPPFTFRLVPLVLLFLIGLGVVFLVTRKSHRPPRPAPGGAPETTAPALPPAEQALRAALASHPNDPASLEALGRYLLDQHRPFEALWQLTAVQEIRPSDPGALVQIARSLIRAGLPAAALQWLDTHHATPTGDMEIPKVRAVAALATARPADASAILLQTGRRVEYSSEAQLLLGDACAAAGDTTGAQAAYQRAAALSPNSPAAQDRLGRLALAAEQCAAARQAFAAAHQKAPQEPGPLYRQGLAAAGAGDHAEAERLWQEAITVAPRYAPALAALGRLARDRKNWSAAMGYLTNAAKLDPTLEAAQLTLAEVLMARGDQGSAAYQRGFCDLETDRPHLALADFRRLAAAAPERIEGPLMISLAYIQMQRLDLAAAEAQRGLKRHPRDPRLLARLVQLHTISHNRMLARQLCEQWLKWDPAANEPASLLGRIAREEHRLPDAVRYGEQVLAREPENAAACFQLSKTLSEMPGAENQRRALELARRAVALAPREADHWQQLGALLRGAGQREEAAGALLHSLDLNPASLESRSLLVQIAAQDRRTATSRFFAHLVTELEARARTGDALWRVVYQHPQDAATHERLARHLLAYGDLRRARFQLQQVVALNPADGAARRDLAIVERLRALQEP